MAHQAKDALGNDLFFNSNGTGVDAPNAITNEIDIRTIGLPTAGENGNRNVTTPGTSVTLTVGSFPISSGVLVQSRLTNTDLIWVGFSTGDLRNVAVFLEAGRSIFIEIDDLQKVRIDANVGGEGVVYTAT